MAEKEVTKISLSTFFLIIALIVIFVMAIFLYLSYDEKIKANDKSLELQAQVTNLERSINNLQEKMDSNSAVENTNTTKPTSTTMLDKKYENSKYGITFSYPSSLSDSDSSLTNDMVESFIDNNGNQIVIARFDNDTIENIIDFEKNKVMPDGTKIELDIKKEGYVTLDSGTKGYCIETNDNSIVFITEKNDMVFRFTIIYTTGNETLSNAILNSFSLK